MRRTAEASLELFRLLRDERRTALALNQLGIALSNLDDIDGGIACHEENAAISRRLGDGTRLSAALNNLGYCLLRRGRNDRATALFEEGLTVCREIGHRTGESVMLGNLGLSAVLERRPAEALGFFRLALLIDRELDYAEGRIYDLVGIAAALSAGARLPDAAILLGAAHAAARATAVELEPLEVEVDAKATETLRAALGAEQLAQAHATGRALSLDEAVEHALRVAGSQETVTGRLARKRLTTAVLDRGGMTVRARPHIAPGGGRARRQRRALRPGHESRRRRLQSLATRTSSSSASCRSRPSPPVAAHARAHVRASERKGDRARTGDKAGPMRRPSMTCSQQLPTPPRPEQPGGPE